MPIRQPYQTAALQILPLQLHSTQWVQRQLPHTAGQDTEAPTPGCASGGVKAGLPASVPRERGLLSTAADAGVQCDLLADPARSCSGADWPGGGAARLGPRRGSRPTRTVSTTASWRNVACDLDESSDGEAPGSPAEAHRSRSQGPRPVRMGRPAKGSSEGQEGEVHISVDNESDDTHTVIHFLGRDAPGLLGTITNVMHRDLRLNISRALIDTYADGKAHDVFFVQRNGSKLEARFESFAVLMLRDVVKQMESRPQDRKVCSVRNIEFHLAERLLEAEGILQPGAVSRSRSLDTHSGVASVLPKPEGWDDQDSENPSPMVKSVSTWQWLRSSHSAILREKRVKELTEDIVHAGNRSVPHRGPHCVPLLRLSGILPWDMDGQRGLSCRFSLFYQWAVLMFVALSLSVCIAKLVMWHSPRSDTALCSSRACVAVGLLSDVPLALSSLLGLLCLDAPRGSAELSESHAVLVNHISREGFLSLWTKLSIADLALAVGIWFFALVLRLYSSGAFDIAGVTALSTWPVLSLASFAINTFVFVGITFLALHISRALAATVDSFCDKILSGRIILHSSQDWNLLQAVLLKVSASIEHSVFCLQIAGVVTVLIAIIDAKVGHWQPLAFIPAALLSSLVVHVSFRIASVTEKCVRVPSLINSAGFGPGVEHLSAVQHIVNSGAGFYVLKVRITSALVFKSMYMCCAAGVFLSTTRL